MTKQARLAAAGQVGGAAGQVALWCGVVLDSRLAPSYSLCSSTAAGLHGKLRKLPSSHVNISSSAPQHGRAAALDVLDALLAGCVVHKKEKLEAAVLCAE